MHSLTSISNNDLGLSSYICKVLSHFSFKSTLFCTDKSVSVTDNFNANARLYVLMMHEMNRICGLDIVVSNVS